MKIFLPWKFYPMVYERVASHMVVRHWDECEKSFNRGVEAMHVMFAVSGRGILKDQWPKYKDQF